jgi:ABC-type transport system involved in multi-copper enzyme maturation permease subunit
MSAMLAIAWFDFVRRLRMVSTYVYFVLFAVIAGLWMAAAGGALSNAAVNFGGDKVLINGPYALAFGIAFIGFVAVTVIGSVSGRAVQQDFEYGTYHFFYTAPIRKADYFFGRLIGAWMTLVLVFLSIALGIVVGSHWPGVDSARIVAHPSFQSFLRPYLFLLIPNMLWLSGCFFVLAALTRQMAPVYVAGVILLVGYMMSINLLGDMENKTLAAMIDPSGATAFDVLARYWSVAQKNTQEIPLEGEFLWNRLLWLGVGVVVTLAGFAAFRMQAVTASATRKRKAAEGTSIEPARARIALPEAQLDRRTAAYARMLPGLARLYLTEILRSPRFLTIVLGGVLLVIGNAFTLGSIYGTNTYPLTYKVLDLVAGLFSLFVLIVTAIYAGELVWRERDTRIEDITDSMPAPTWLGFLAKFAALVGLQVALMLVVLACSVGVQVAKGYTNFELGHYVFELFVLQLPGFILVAVLALTVHTLVDNKYVGHFLVLLVFLFTSRMADFGWEDRLYRYASRPDIVYSDLNGYGHFLPAVMWFRLYWSAFAVILLLLAYALWVRGRDGGWRARLSQAAMRMTPAAWSVAGVAAAAFVGTGAWIYYNTHILNTYVTRKEAQRLAADYEKKYKPLAAAPQPKVTAADVKADIYPDEQRARISGTLSLVNANAQPVSDVYVLYPRAARDDEIAFSVPAQLVDAQPLVRWHHYRLATPMAPGATMELRFALTYGARGFRNEGADPTVLANGTFLNPGLNPDTALIPSFGYDESAELTSDSDRKKFGLGPRPRAPDLDDRSRHMQSALSRDADFIAYRGTVCTSADQLPVTSGYVERDWTENGRRCIAYRMDTPMAAIYPFVSARYAVLRDVWKGPDGDVAIEIDYHKGHEYNLDRMVAGVKDSLDYFTTHFGPYQHRILRIVEFPRFTRQGGFAESFPNSVPFNEALGFTAKVNDRDPKDIDYPYFITAHEVAHQWWAHQEVPANVQGGEFITESLAEYSALMVLRKKYGAEKMRRFLKYELDRYLAGRGTEQKGEQPLLRADGAAYVHYQKGAHALYALQDVIGEKAMDDALSAFVGRWRFKGPPYPTSRDLVAELRRVTPAEHQVWIDDLFLNITFFANRAVKAQARKRPDGNYDVDLVFTARKSRADATGNETDAPLDAVIDVGVQDAKGAYLLLEKRRVKSGENKVTVTVAGEPAKAGIDPLDKLIDRDTDDNTVEVTRS